MLKAPNWAKNAVPTARGWVDPRTGELLVARQISQLELNEYYSDAAPSDGQVSYETSFSVPEHPEHTVETLWNQFQGDKNALDEWAHEKGIELDKRKTFINMAEEFVEKQ